MKIDKHAVLVNGNTVYYKKAGTGDPLILVHGLSGSTRWWRRNIDALSKKYEVYLIDLPGFGSMRRFPKRIVLKDAAVWLKEWMQVVGIKRAHFIGHSMGGYLCLQLAATSPNTICCLVLVSPAGITSTRTIFHYIIALILAIRYLTFSFIPVLLLDALRAGPITLIRSALEVIKGDMGEDVKKITFPTLLIWGKHDTLVPAETGKLLKSLLPNATLHIINNAGHVPMFDQPEEFNKIVLTFLAKKNYHYVVSCKNR